MENESDETLAAFLATLEGEEPPEGVSGPVAALWYLEKGDWGRAHDLVQDDESQAGAWVHAHVHRVEGDLGNARYWYGRAGRPVPSLPTRQERLTILSELLVGNA